MTDRPTARKGRCCPSVLQWNTNSLRQRHVDVTLHLLQSECDILALQEVYAVAEALRLPGYTGYSGATTCTTCGCTDAPCLADAHHTGKPRAAIYVRSNLAHAVVPVANVVGGPLECCAVTVRLGNQDMTVASMYIHPGKP
ncbi:uncharacterized protein [Dermacentor albipictus]|uniref:uncharacterized protein n=1 Tax=Dermacentor albipictus TaxID=60249 RepID=UPI0031FC9B1E